MLSDDAILAELEPTAATLARAGRSVLVLEAAQDVGGAARECAAQLGFAEGASAQVDAGEHERGLSLGAVRPRVGSGPENQQDKNARGRRGRLTAV